MNPKVFIIAILLSLSSSILASESAPRGATGIIIESLKKRPKDTTPEEVNATCYYLNGNLHIEFITPEGKATATITHMDSGDAISRTFLTFSPATISIGTVPGLYEILIDTTSGGKYLGHLTID